ncbi:hypothetical protein [Undibacterium curvum]|uniref:Uncharacterized protein n=1 Tax=Undibacterium curvum TaxID=2762294 RepID=A0ABR7A444_9BURK|nr:hypothetical protein [Undibacterium curvum]MBC3931658.1 hypothetical protein [Undibacterium curvum]
MKKNEDSFSMTNAILQQSEIAKAMEKSALDRNALENGIEQSATTRKAIENGMQQFAADRKAIENGMQQFAADRKAIENGMQQFAADRKAIENGMQQFAADRKAIGNNLSEIALAREAAQKPFIESHAQLQSAMAEIGNQLKTAMEAPQKILQLSMANIQKHLDDASKQIYEPLRLLVMAADLYRAIKEDNHSEVDAIMASPDFGAQLLHLLVRWTEMNEEERSGKLAEMVVESNKRAEMAIELDQQLKKIKTGYLNRQDQIDKQVLIAYFKEKNHVIKNSAELEKWPFDDWPLTNNYSIEIIKKWYKEAMPNVNLVGGRPKKGK